MPTASVGMAPKRNASRGEHGPLPPTIDRFHGRRSGGDDGLPTGTHQRPARTSRRAGSRRPRRSARRRPITPLRPTKPEPPPPPPTIPDVAMSDAIRATCLLNVGQAMPAAELPDLAGNLRSLRSLTARS